MCTVVMLPSGDFVIAAVLASLVEKFVDDEMDGDNDF